MYSFLPPLLIILSLAGIVILVVRRTPELKEVEVRSAVQSFWAWIKKQTGRFWRFVLEVKEVSTPKLKQIPKKLPKVSSKLPKAPKIKFSRKKQKPEEPEPVGALLQRAEQSLKQRDHETAERLYIETIKQDARNQSAYEGLGRLYLQQKKFKEAKETYQFLAKRFPNNLGYKKKLQEIVEQKNR